MFNRHRHVWKIVKQVEQPSPFDVMAEKGAIPTKVTDPHVHMMFARSVIVTRRCDLCGTEEVRRV